MLTPEGFARGMAPLLAVWEAKDLPDDTQEVYWRLCAHLPDDVFQGAVLAVLSAHSYGFPKPGDILDAAVQVVMDARELSEGWARQELADYKLKHVKQLVAANRVRAAQLAADPVKQLESKVTP